MRGPESVTQYLVSTSISDEYHTDILNRKSFDVNMRLFERSMPYRNIILNIIKYLGWIMAKTFTDYGKVKGISGANVGIPFNIVGIRATRNLRTKALSFLKDDILFLINPKITSRSPQRVEVRSNCGSLLLPKKIKVERHKTISVEYCDISGRKSTLSLEGSMAYTVQHEVDHNLGILITYRAEE